MQGGKPTHAATPMIGCFGHVLFALVLAMPGYAAAAHGEPISVHAAASTGPLLTELAGAYERSTGTKVRVSLGASSTLARQIQEGSTADLFISADPAWINDLAESGRVLRQNIAAIAANEIVLAAPIDSPFDWTPTDDLATSFEGFLVMGDPSHVPVGRYGKEALTRSGQWEALQGRRVFAPDAASALAQLASGRARAGIVYRSDLARSKLVVQVHRFLEPTVKIWGAVLNPDRGAGFWSYIRSAKGREIILKHGFTLPKNETALPVAAPKPVQAQGIGPVVWLSLRVAMLSVLIILPFGIFFGWLLARREFFGKDVLDAFLHLPLVLPPVVTGYALLWCFGRNGPFGGLGLAFTWEGAAIASAVVAFPLFVRAARLGFESVDIRLEEAAQTLGARPRRVFFKVTLPLALSGIVSGAILAFGRSLGEFGATITFAGSVAGETETLPLALYAAIQTPEGEAQAMTLALVSTLLAFVSLIAGEWIARRVRWKS